MSGKLMKSQTLVQRLKHLGDVDMDIQDKQIAILTLNMIGMPLIMVNLTEHSDAQMARLIMQQLKRSTHLHQTVHK